MTQPEFHQFGGVLREFSGDWTPIFADKDREYAYLTEVTSSRAVEGGAELEVRTESGETVHASVRFVTPEVFRLRMWLSEEPPVDSPMLVDGARRTHAAEVSDDRKQVVLDSGALRVRLSRSAWSIAVAPAAGQAFFEQRWEDRQIRGAVTLPTGFSRDASGRVQFHEVFSLESDEHIYGLGEHFGPIDRKGQHLSGA